MNNSVHFQFLRFRRQVFFEYSMNCANFANLNSNIIRLKIGTRGSALALWQAHTLQAKLKSVGSDSELVIIKTKGDKIQHLGFDKLEGKGFFTKEIEEALLAGEIDVAVHSLKDLPTTNPDGLAISGLSERADCADMLLIHPDATMDGTVRGLKPGSVIGTSSIRRKTQLKAFFSDIEVKDLRGNVPTRVQKLADGQYDAIVLAAAGLQRLEVDLSAFVVYRFNPKEFVPAPGQGVVAYQCRTNDTQTRKIIQKIHYSAVAKSTNVERKILNLMDGGCHIPLGAYCEVDESGNYHVFCTYTPSEGETKNVRLSQSTHDQLAEKVVTQLKK